MWLLGEGWLLSAHTKAAGVMCSSLGLEQGQMHFTVAGENRPVVNSSVHVGQGDVRRNWTADVDAWSWCRGDSGELSCYRDNIGFSCVSPGFWLVSQSLTDLLETNLQSNATETWGGGRHCCAGETCEMSTPPDDGGFKAMISQSPKPLLHPISLQADLRPS